MPRVELDVGGKIYKTTISTLTSFPDTFLTQLFNGNWQDQEDGNGRVFIDRDGETFRYVLEFLRNRDQAVMPFDDEFLLKQIRLEAQFFLLPQLAEFLDRNDPRTLAMHSNRRVQLVWCTDSDIRKAGLAQLSNQLNQIGNHASIAPPQDTNKRLTILSMAQLSSVPNSYFWHLAKNIANKTLELDIYGTFEYHDGKYYIPFRDETDWLLAKSVCQIMIGDEVDYERLSRNSVNCEAFDRDGSNHRTFYLDLLSRFVKMSESMKIPKAVDCSRKLWNAVKNRTKILE